ncbi:beta-defensin 126-like [Antechinus flavipes]|uniref:beta-defensin 126-like n=1 Tax=Antechinus flavipes TaxID=38775 RepID=UPI002235AF61|nr:beta-defensin 126-like [Antechinus flavipes]
MKVAFLTSVFLILVQAPLGGWTEKKCWNNTGRCRNQCKSTETDHSTCANKKRCCVPTDRFPKDSWELPVPDNTTSSTEITLLTAGALNILAPGGTVATNATNAPIPAVALITPSGNNPPSTVGDSAPLAGSPPPSDHKLQQDSSLTTEAVLTDQVTVPTQVIQVNRVRNKE